MDATPIWRRLLAHCARPPLFMVPASAGSNVTASNTTIAITTSSSIRVKACSGCLGTVGVRFDCFKRFDLLINIFILPIAREPKNDSFKNLSDNLRGSDSPAMIRRPSRSPLFRCVTLLAGIIRGDEDTACDRDYLLAPATTDEQ